MPHFNGAAGARQAVNAAGCRQETGEYAAQFVPVVFSRCALRVSQTNGTACHIGCDAPAWRRARGSRARRGSRTWYPRRQRRGARVPTARRHRRPGDGDARPKSPSDIQCDRADHRSLCPGCPNVLAPGSPGCPGSCAPCAEMAVTLPSLHATCRSRFAPLGGLLSSAGACCSPMRSGTSVLRTHLAGMARPLGRACRPASRPLCSSGSRRDRVSDLVGSIWCLLNSRRRS